MPDPQTPDPAPTPDASPPPTPAAPVKVIDKAGNVFDARPDQVPGALKNGYEVLSPEDVHRHQIQQEESAKGLSGSLGAAASSFGNQALGGVPGIIARHIQTAQENADDEIRDEVHKVARFGGGALGLAGNVAALGGAATAAGEAIAGQTIAPAAELATASLGTRLAAQSLNLATQGAVMSAPAALTQAAFGDPKAAAETLSWGFGLGGVLGTGGELLGSIGRKAAEAGAAEAAESGGAARVVKEGLGDVAEASLKKQADEEAAPVASAVAPEVPKGPPPEVEEAASKFIELRKQAYDAIDDHMANDPSREVVEHQLTPYKIVSALNELDVPEIKNPLTQEAADAGKALLQEAAKLPTDGGRVSFDTAQNFLDKLSERTDPLGQTAYHAVQNTVTESADRIAAQEPELAKALQTAKVQGEAIAQLKQQAAQDAATKAVADEANLRGALVDGPPPPIIPTAQPPGLLGKLPLAARSALGGAAKQAVGAAAGVAGHAVAGPFGAYLARKGAIAAVDWLKPLAKMWGNSGSGLTVLSSLAKRTAAEGPEVFSATVAAESAKRVAATMATVGDTIKRMAIQGLSTTGASRMDHMKSLLGDTSGLSHDQQYAKLGSRLASLASNPAALANVTSALSAPYATTAPEVARSYQEHIAQTVQYLHNALPKPPGPPLPFAPQNWAPTPTETLAFHDKAEIVANPMRALVHVERGTLSDAHMDALANVWPQTHAKMIQTIMQVHADNPSLKLGLRERTGLSKFVGAPLDPTELPQNLIALQKSYAQSNPGGSPPQEKRPKGKIKDRMTAASSFSSTMGPASEPA